MGASASEKKILEDIQKDIDTNKLKEAPKINDEIKQTQVIESNKFKNSTDNITDNKFVNRKFYGFDSDFWKEPKSNLEEKEEVDIPLSQSKPNSAPKGILAIQVKDTPHKSNFQAAIIPTKKPSLEQPITNTTAVIEEEPSTWNKIKGLDWNRAFNTFVQYAGGASADTGGDWGKAVGNGLRQANTYLEYLNQKEREKEKYAQDLLAAKLKEEKNDRQKALENYLAFQKLNLAKQKLILDSQNTSSGKYNENLIPQEIYNIPNPRNEEEREAYINLLYRVAPQYAESLVGMANNNLPVKNFYEKLPINLLGDTTRVLRNINPDFDVNAYETASKTIRELGDGKSDISKTLVNINTLAQHLNGIYEKAPNLTNSDTRFANMLTNKIKNQLSNPEVRAMLANVKSFSAELERFFTGSRPTKAMIEKSMDMLSPDSTMEELYDVIRTFQDLLGGRVYSYIRRWYGNTKKGFPSEMVDPLISTQLVNNGYLKYSHDQRYIYPVNAKKDYKMNGFGNFGQLVFDENGDITGSKEFDLNEDKVRRYFEEAQKRNHLYEYVFPGEKLNFKDFMRRN